MKTPQPSQCEIGGHEIQLKMFDTSSVPYLGIKCVCKTCGAEWLENYQRIFVGDETKAVHAKIGKNALFPNADAKLDA